MNSEDIVKAITRVETKVEGIEKTLVELKSEFRSPKSPVLPVTGGVVGLVAAACTAYLQVTGQA